MIKKEIKRLIQKYTLKALIHGIIAYLSDSFDEKDQEFARAIQEGFDEWKRK